MLLHFDLKKSHLLTFKKNDIKKVLDTDYPL